MPAERGTHRRLSEARISPTSAREMHLRCLIAPAADPNQAFKLAAYHALTSRARNQTAFIAFRLFEASDRSSAQIAFYPFAWRPRRAVASLFTQLVSRRHSLVGGSPVPSPSSPSRPLARSLALCEPVGRPAGHPLTRSLVAKRELESNSISLAPYRWWWWW